MPRFDRTRKAWPSTGLAFASVTEGALGTDVTTCAITARYMELCGCERSGVAPRAHHRPIGDGTGAQSQSAAIAVAMAVRSFSGHPLA
jgi:hypothetical protein